MSNIDPNWLMSTAAQSAAAIVAIVGGFLVSRLVAANSEKASLLRRLAEARLRVGEAEADVGKARASLLRSDASDIVDENIDYIMENDTNVTADDLLMRSTRSMWSPQELEPELTRLLEEYQRAFKVLSDMSHQLPDQEWKELKVGLQLGDLSETQDEIWDSVFTELEYRNTMRRSQPGGLAPFDLSPRMIVSNATVTHRLQRQRDISASLAAEEHRLAAAQSEAKYVTDALDRLPSAGDLWGGFVVLALFALTGVLLPLVLIASQSGHSLSFERKATVLAGFGFGLLVLAGYLVRQIRNLDSKDT